MKNNILITGVSSGIGKHLAMNLGGENNIYGVSRTDPGIGGMDFNMLDLLDFDAVSEYAESIRDTDFKAIIINAGIGYFDRFENMSQAEILSTMNLNAISPMIFIRDLIPHMSKSTKIIFIGSVAGKKFFRYGAVYQASKFALRGFAGSLRNEIKNSVFILNPQFVDTGFFKNERLEIQSKGGPKETKLEAILKIVRDILDGTEKRFEIDL